MPVTPVRVIGWGLAAIVGSCGVGCVGIALALLWALAKAILR